MANRVICLNLANFAITEKFVRFQVYSQHKYVLSTLDVADMNRQHVPRVVLPFA